MRYTDEDEEYAERISEVKSEVAAAMEAVGVVAEPHTLENDLWVTGPLTAILEAAHEYRSEIEELGD